MQLSMGYDRIDGKKILFLLCTLFFGITLQAQNQDFSRVKSKYDFKTEATDQLMRLMSESTKYDEALKFADNKIAEASKTNQYEELVLLLERKAELLRRIQKFDEAEKTATQAIKIAKNQLGKNHFLLSKSFLTRGIIAHRKTDYYTASANFDSAQIIYEKALQYDSLIYDRIIDYKYYAYTYAEKNTDTLKKYIDIRLKNAQANPKSTPHDLIYLMDDYPRLYRELGDFDQALAYSILQVIYANDNIDNIDATDHTSAYFNLIYTLYYLKKYDLALSVCDDILKFYRSVKKYRESINLNNIYSLRPSILIGLNKYNLAINDYITLISDFDKSTKQNEIKFLIQNEINLASCYLRVGNDKKAKYYLDLALVSLKSINKLPAKQAASLFSIKGDYYRLNDDYINSFASYDSAVRNDIPEYFLDDPLNFPIIENQKVSFKVLLGLKDKALSLNNLFINDLKDSLQLLYSADQYVQRTNRILLERRKELTRSEGKLFLSSNFKSLYEAGIQSSFLLSTNGHLTEGHQNASKFFKMSKSILFLEQAGEFDFMTKNNIPQYLKERYYTLSKRTKALNDKFYQNFSHLNILTDSIRNLNLDLLDATKSFSSLKDSLSSFMNMDEDMFLSVQSKNDILEPRELSMEFFVGDSVIYILGSMQEGTVLEAIKLDSNLKSHIEYLIKEVSTRPQLTDYSALVSNFKFSSNYVYESLLAPVLSQLDQNIKTITIIPDEFLSKLPFEVLLTQKAEEKTSFKDLPYLIKSYTIKYKLTGTTGGGAHSKTAKKDMLGIGYSYDSNQDKSSRVGLPGTDLEIKQIQSKFSGDYYLGEDATKNLFLKEAQNFDILHLAVHGETDEKNKYNARLIFNGKDSLLNTGDLYLANIQARMVVLSACESGTGEVVKGEGTFSIARGFALLGVPSIIMSLWNVNDKVTSQLMSNFYVNISKGLSSTEALSQSKLTYLEKSDNYTSHPYYWSSFVSLGDPIQLFSKPFSYLAQIFVALISLLTLAVLLWFFARQKRRRII
jgi:CHAT domain-containing protein